MTRKPEHLYDQEGELNDHFQIYSSLGELRELFAKNFRDLLHRMKVWFGLCGPPSIASTFMKASWAERPEQQLSCCQGGLIDASEACVPF